MTHEIENFQGVYLLYNLNPKYKGRTYIGYTVNPKRRIWQHNTGKQAGGAWKTDGKGPWEMVLIIHGFPNSISALRFEWAWQHPDISRRLKNITKKSNKEKAYEYRFRVVCHMLRTGPWNRLPLTIRWLKQEYRLDFPPNLLPPVHMPISFGPVVCKKVENKENEAASDVGNDEEELPVLSQNTSRCSVCVKRIMPEDITLKCIHPSCLMVSHILCLSRLFLRDSAEIIPVDGICPSCSQTMLWGDLIRLKHGCYQNLTEVSCSDSDDNS